MVITGASSGFGRAAALAFKREVTFGRAGRLVQLLHELAPGLYGRLLPRFFELFTFDHELRAPGPGNLFEPTAPFGRIDGDWGRLARGPGGNGANGMSEADDRHEALATYLNDHLAGASGGLELARRMAERYRDGELGVFLDQLVREVDEDRETLKEAMQRLGIAENSIKQALAWAGEKLTRLKPNETFVSPSRLSRLIELETMALGVEGKLSLWRSLESAGISAGLDLPELIARATRQREGLERHRREAAAAVLRADDAHSPSVSARTAR